MAVPGTLLWALCALLFCTVLLSAPFSSACSALILDVVSAGQVATASAIGNITYQTSQIADFVTGAGWPPPSGATER